MDALLNIIWVILAFSILVIIHEFGHFILAKLNGVKVEEFAIGMGPKLFGVRGKETLYAFRLIPIGGYVKMLGEEGDSEDERSFSNKSPLRRLSIVAAGPIMNFILAIVLFAVVGYLKGFLIPVVSEVIPQSPAIKAGIQPGDRILEINKHKISTWEDVMGEVAISKGEPLNIYLQRNNEKKIVVVRPMKNAKEGTYMLGVYSSALEKPSFTKSVSYGIRETNSTVKQTFQSLGMLFKGKASLKKDIGGPVTILRVTWAVSKAGLVNLVRFSAFISIQLGIFNLLPIPALDGFWALVSLYEIITRRRINRDKLGTVSTIGFTLLLVLMVVVTIKDVLYPIKL